MSDFEHDAWRRWLEADDRLKYSDDMYKALTPVNITERTDTFQDNNGEHHIRYRVVSDDGTLFYQRFVSLPEGNGFLARIKKGAAELRLQQDYQKKVREFDHPARMFYRNRWMRNRPLWFGFGPPSLPHQWQGTPPSRRKYEHYLPQDIEGKYVEEQTQDE